MVYFLQHGKTITVFLLFVIFFILYNTLKGPIRISLELMLAGRTDLGSTTMI